MLSITHYYSDWCQWASRSWWCSVSTCPVSLEQTQLSAPLTLHSPIVVILSTVSANSFSRNNMILLLLHSVLVIIGTVDTAGFDGIPGDYCSKRTPSCCVNRDDDCTAPILNNHACYCDMFCDRSDGGDCCPDFKAVCRGGAQPEPRLGKCPLRLYMTTHIYSFVDCSYNGQQYRNGDRTQQNCQSCTCTNDRWSCDTTEACLIQDDLLDRVQKGRYT